LALIASVIEHINTRIDALKSYQSKGRYACSPIPGITPNEIVGSTGQLVCGGDMDGTLGAKQMEAKRITCHRFCWG